MNPLATIQGLIELACGSHSEEEARTSALAACKAIKRHGVILTLADLDETAPARNVPSSTPFDGDPFAGSYHTPSSPSSSVPRPRAPREKKAASRNHFEREGFARQNFGEPMGRARRIASKFETFCKGCGVASQAGDTIFWRRGVGTSCLQCGSRVLELDVTG